MRRSTGDSEFRHDPCYSLPKMQVFELFVIQPKGGRQTVEPRELNSVAAQEDFRTLADEVVEVCKLRGWSLHWTERGAYLHLESSELVEAVRGKRGEIVKEAGDVLFVLLSILQPNNVTVADAVAALRSKIAELKTKPRYAGEQYCERKERRKEEVDHAE